MKTFFKSTLIVLFFSVLIINRAKIQKHLIEGYESYVSIFSSKTTNQVAYLGV
ncbi:hypothetical protein [Olleya sp. R77988]|uniref:hypothetical protein n=1 Tax=Olleya sp. R77988 TaxID=3093875 RepID=UPI0037C7EE85